jgi:hypothetical protein
MLDQNQEQQLEDARRAMVGIINTNPQTRERLEEVFGKGQVWTTKELSEEFEVISFLAPFAVVKRRADHDLGSVMFQHHPRLYFAYVSDDTSLAV